MTKRANLQIALLSGLIALGGTTLVAQNADKAEGGKQSHFVQLDTDMNGEVTAEEMKAHAAARFAAADADGDGFLTQDELAAAAKARHAERSQRMLEKLAELQESKFETIFAPLSLASSPPPVSPPRALSRRRPLSAAPIPS